MALSPFPVFGCPPVETANGFLDMVSFCLQEGSLALEGGKWGEVKMAEVKGWRWRLQGRTRSGEDVAGEDKSRGDCSP